MKLVLTLFMIATLSASAQTNVNQYIVPLNNIETEEDEDRYEVVIKKNNTYTPGYLNNIPAAVLSEFTKNYVGATNVSWFVDEKTSTVYFAHNDEISTVKYQQDGLVLLKRKTYGPNKVKPSLAKYIQEQAVGYDIRYVNESERDNAHHYEINLVKNGKWQVLKLNEDNAGQFLVTGRVSFDK